MLLSRLVKVALLCAAIIVLAGTVEAGDIKITPVYPATPAPVVHQSAPVIHDAGCCPTACQPIKKICISEPDKKTHTTVKYRCECKTICLPNCSALLGGKCCTSGCDSACGPTECGKPREVRRLYKRFVKEEQCATKCVPVDAPVCQPGCPTPCATPAHAATPVYTLVPSAPTTPPTKLPPGK